ncbi:MAG TPA: BlaI/MecI/CopY family transcriptional regulator [Polyangiaceae bacterium]|nr:BlaI/MecI/CopY family transcriptional regulator [Polyangiaceae bacterium]
MASVNELGPLEMQVLGLFGVSDTASVTDVQGRLRESGTELAYTTVMTVLSRLHEKGLLVRRKDGRRFLYALAKNAPAMTDGIVARIHRALFRKGRLRPLVALLDEDELSTGELRALRKLVDAKLKERAE